MPAMFESGVFTDGQAAWHGMGTVVEQRALTAEEALRLSGLGGWELEKLPLFTRTPKGDVIEVPDRYAHVRTSDNRVLGVVGNVYRGLTNEEAFEWADELVGGFGCHYKTAGSLYGGKVVWLLLETPFEINLPDSKLRNMIYLTNSHDGSAAVEAAFTSVRIVCANTLSIAKASGVDRVKVKHTTNNQERLAQAQRTMHLVEGAAQRASEIAEKLYAQKVSEKKFTEVLDAVFPLPDLKGKSYDDLSRGEKKAFTGAENKREAVILAYANGEGASDVRGTAWGVYNAFSAAYQHQEIDGKDEAQNMRKAQSIFANIMDAKSPADAALAVLTR